MRNPPPTAPKRRLVRPNVKTMKTKMSRNGMRSLEPDVTGGWLDYPQNYISI
jgi:hypothetical protein